MLFERPSIRYCEESGRLFLRHGPIDLFVSVDAESEEIVIGSYELVAAQFGDILPTLCEELPSLRTGVQHMSAIPTSPVASKMYASAKRFSDFGFTTPMIAVAGSVAEHIRDLVAGSFETDRIIVNNGGDISLFLGGDQTMKIGICDDIANPQMSTSITIEADSDIGGVATSGWKGRSFSLGIADAVTVLAIDAAAADAAATLIANAVDLPGSLKIKRIAASELAPDSDLGDRLVTTDVASLSVAEIEEALARGRSLAEQLLASGHIQSAYLSLQGSRTVVDAADLDEPAMLRNSLNPSQIAKPELIDA